MLAVIAATCAALGFGELAGALSVYAKIMAFPAFVLAVIFLITASATRRKTR